MAMDPAVVERTLEIPLRQQLELAGNLQRLENALAETQGLLDSLAQIRCRR